MQIFRAVDFHALQPFYTIRNLRKYSEGVSLCPQSEGSTVLFTLIELLSSYFSTCHEMFCRLSSSCF